MLQVMRSMAQSWIFKGLMMLLVVSFGIWGVGDMFRDNPMARAIAKVGGKPITVRELEQSFQQALADARKSYPELTAPQARQMGLLDQTLTGLTQKEAFNLEAKRLGIDVGDKVILDGLAHDKRFRDKDGRFNMELWHQILSRGGVTERGFLDQERTNTARRMIYNVLMNSAVLPDGFVDALTRARGAKRIVEIVSIDNASVKNFPDADDETLKAYYEANTPLFSSPEMRSLVLAVLSTDAIEKDLVISDEDLHKAFETRLPEFAQTEHRDILQVVAPDEAKAKELSAAAHDKKSLAAAAKAMGLSAVNLANLDDKTVLPELYTTVFTMEEGQISDAVQSPLGWHVVEVKKIHPEVTPSFDQVKNKIRDTLRQEQSADAAMRAVNQLDDALASGTSLEEIADSLKMRLVKIPAIDAKGLTPEGKEPAELPFKDLILPTGFGQGAGEVSSVMDDRKGSYFVVQTADVTPARVRSFDEARADVVKAWRKSEQGKRAMAKAEQLAEEWRKGKSASSFAGEAGVEVRVSKPISRLGEKDPTLPLTALPKIYQMKKGDVVTAEAPGKALVLRLANVLQIDPAKDGAARLRVVDDLHDKGPLELLGLYSDHLKTLFPTTINRDLLETERKRGTQ